MPDLAHSSTLQTIAALWQRNRPQVLQRLQTLDRAAAADSQQLTPELREEAKSIAHQFAGSLGMFGFHEGTEIARKIEREFEASQPRFDRLENLLQKLRTSLFSPNEYAIGESGSARAAAPLALSQNLPAPACPKGKTPDAMPFFRAKGPIDISLGKRPRYTATGEPTAEGAT